MNDPERTPKDIYEVIQQHQARSPESEEPELAETDLDPAIFKEVETEEEIVHALYKALREAREPLVEMMKGKRELDADEFKERSTIVRELEYRIAMHPTIYRLRNASERLHIDRSLGKLTEQSTRLKNSIRETERELKLLKHNLEMCEDSAALLRRWSLHTDWPIKGLDFVTPLAFYLANAPSEEVNNAMSELTPEKGDQLRTLVQIVKLTQRLEPE